MGALLRRLIGTFVKRTMADGTVGYVASSAQIARSFGDVTGEEDAVAFRHTLRMVATRLGRREGGDGGLLWRLHQEYHPASSQHSDGRK
jgi:hypothetical protein